MAIQKLSDQEIDAQISQVSGWAVQDNKLHCQFKFKDFVEAWGFMSQVAILAERADHHPEWSNVYNRVIIDLTTHEADGITIRDFDLAREINQILTY
ncbi:MAG: 4a-hydroxytetrahydrobiopterin dehydratase [Chloroflexota bacterium]